jgi:hypothetical protein
MKIRGAAAVATGLAVAASFGLGVLGTASAAAPTLHIKQGSKWTSEVNGGGGCQIDIFAANGTFVGGDGYDAGIWNQTAPKVRMKWTAGYVKGLEFKGAYTTSTNPPEFKGTYNGIGAGDTGQLVKGDVANWDGFTC